MTALDLQTCRRFAAVGVERVRRELVTSMLRALNFRSGDLMRSIAVETRLTPVGENGMIMAFHAVGGGGRAFYGIFHEFGTGVMAENTAAVKAGYHEGEGFGFEATEGEHVEFYGPRQEKGYLILRRRGPAAGTVLSRGVPATHWFDAGLQGARAAWRAMAVQCASELTKLEDWEA